MLPRSALPRPHRILTSAAESLGVSRRARRVIIAEDDRRGFYGLTRSARSSKDPLPSIRFHDLRHVHATLLLKAGVPVYVVAVRLGQRDPSMTLRVCAHVLSDQGASAAQTFANLFIEDDEDDSEEGNQ